MSEPARLRGEVGERRRHLESLYCDQANKGLVTYGFVYCDPAYRAPDQSGPERREFDRRGAMMLTPGRTAARIDAIVQAIRDPLNEVIARLKAENATLTRQLNEHMDEVAHLTGTVEHLRGVVARAARAIERDRIEPLLAKGQPEECHD